MHGVDQRTLVTLTREELVEAATVGARRNAEDLADGKGIGYFSVYDDWGWTVHIIGAIGERVFAKFMQVPWEPAPMKGVDVAGCMVRCSMKATSPLRVRDRDADDKVYVLVVNNDPKTFLRWRVAGYCSGKEGKRPEWRNDPQGRGPVFEVPQNVLKEFVWS